MGLLMVAMFVPFQADFVLWLLSDLCVVSFLPLAVANLGCLISTRAACFLSSLTLHCFCHGPC